MSEYNKCASESSQTLKDDALTHVFGVDRPGRVRGLGFGATTSRVILQEHSRAHVASIEGKLKDLEKEVEDLKAMVFNKVNKNKVPIFFIV